MDKATKIGDQEIMVLLLSIVQVWPSVHINSSILNLSMIKIWLGELGEEKIGVKLHCL